MKNIVNDLEKALCGLREVLAERKTDIVRDSAIKRFELCFDLVWKNAKNYAKDQGVECYSPRECIKVAYSLKLINDEQKWLALLKDRNESVHLYSVETADGIYSRLGAYLTLFEDFLTVLEKIDR